METRKKRLWIRLSDAETTYFKKKATHYDSISAMVRSAVSQLDDRSITDRLAMMDELTAYYKSFDNRLSWIGSNINQLAKRANEAHVAGVIPEAFFKEMLMPELDRLAYEISELKDCLTKIARDSMDFHK